MDAVGDGVAALERIQSTFSEFLSLFERLNVKEREVAPAVDALWIRRRAHLTVPKHSLSSRLSRLGLVAHLQRQLIQAFENEIHALHTVASSALSQACHDLRATPVASPIPEGQQSAEKLAESAQIMFERRVRMTEDNLVALCAAQIRQSSPHTRSKKSHPADEDSALIVVKTEDFSDEGSPGVEADPKVIELWRWCCSCY